MQTAAILLGLAALGGLMIAGMRMSGVERPPTWMAIGHGLIAATGLGFLIAAAAGTGGIPQLALIALIVLVLAAIGGAAIFLGFHLKKKPLPIPLIIGHGLTAIVGYCLLLANMFGGL